MSLRLRIVVAAGALLAFTPIGLSQVTAESGSHTDKSRQQGQSQSVDKTTPSGMDRSSGQKPDSAKSSGGNTGEDKMSTSGSTAHPKGSSGGSSSGSSGGTSSGSSGGASGGGH